MMITDANENDDDDDDDGDEVDDDDDLWNWCNAIHFDSLLQMSPLISVHRKPSVDEVEYLFLRN